MDSETQKEHDHLRLFERRKALFVRAMQGNTVSSLAPSLAKEYAVSAKAVTQDWSRRRRWLPELLGLTDVSAFVQDHIAGQTVVIETLWEEFRTVEQGKTVKEKQSRSAIRAGILRQIAEVRDKIFQVVTQIGLVPDNRREFSVDFETEKSDKDIEDMATADLVAEAAKMEAEIRGIATEIDALEAKRHDNRAEREPEAESVTTTAVQ